MDGAFSRGSSSRHVKDLAHASAQSGVKSRARECHAFDGPRDDRDESERSSTYDEFGAESERAERVGSRGERSGRALARAAPGRRARSSAAGTTGSQRWRAGKYGSPPSRVNSFAWSKQRLSAAGSRKPSGTSAPRIASTRRCAAARPQPKVTARRFATYFRRYEPRRARRELTRARRRA
jgi:hypothetical protein